MCDAMLGPFLKGLNFLILNELCKSLFSIQIMYPLSDTWLMRLVFSSAKIAPFSFYAAFMNIIGLLIAPARCRIPKIQYYINF